MNDPVSNVPKVVEVAEATDTYREASRWTSLTAALHKALRYEELAAGGRAPWWMGRAYRDWTTQTQHFYLIPVNLIVGWARLFWHWAAAGAGQSFVDDRLLDAYADGVRRGIACERARRDCPEEEIEL